MQMSTKKRGSQPWWIILLLIPMLVSCGPIGSIIWNVSLIVGKKVLETAPGQVIEKVIDGLIDILFHTNSPGHVTVDPNDPLKGTYSIPMKFTRKDGGKERSYEITKPKMVRNSESSPWHLAPDFEKEVIETLMSGYSN